jgi:1-acyl-sn-glycerol-3-phosphate acyltransferase
VKVLECHRRAPGMPRFQVIFVWTFMWSVVYLCARLVYGIRLRDRGNVPARGPIIYVANHQSFYDPPIVGLLVNDRPCAFLARASLFESRLFGRFIRWLNAIPLQRGGGSGAGALRSAIAELNAGRSVLLFPEGTRTDDGPTGPFRPGFLLLARKTNAQVVPVAIEGAYDIWPKSRTWPRFRGLLRTKAGPAIPADELLAMEPDEATGRIRRAIETMRLELRDELRQRTRGRWPKPGPGDVPYWEREDRDAKKRA